MTENHYCGTCRWHKFDRKYGDWLCTNEESENYAVFTGYEDMDTCEYWENKNEKRV
ncbi:MAG: hypothetical protein LUG61_04875 [Lachnospiraceae bacterium]|nr:hypothetical protein [Lachnospiraceae bacterium]